MALTTVTFTVETRDHYNSTDEIREDNRRVGGHYFDRDTMRYFRSRVDPIVFGGHYFVTSEQYQSSDGHMEPRLYTVRSCFAGKVDTIGEFQAYPTLNQARTAARRIARDHFREIA